MAFTQHLTFFPDFLGFHKLSDLVYSVSVDIELSSMTLTTCFLICKRSDENIYVAIILESRCICAKGKEKEVFNLF